MKTIAAPPSCETCRHLKAETWPGPIPTAIQPIGRCNRPRVGTTTKPIVSAGTCCDQHEEIKP